MSSPVGRGLLVAVLVAALVTTGLVVSPSTVVGTLESLSSDPFAFGAVVAGLYLLRPMLAWPTTPLALVVGYGFGVAAGIPIALAGVLVTVIPVFLVARRATRRSGGSTVVPGGASVLEETSRVVTRYYDRAGPVRGVTASRLAPIPSDVATCAAAVSGVSLRHLLVGTAVGELPWTVAAVVVGASADTITTDGLGALGGTLAVVCTLAGAALLAGPVYRIVRARLRGRSRSPDLHSS